MNAIQSVVFEKNDRGEKFEVQATGKKISVQSIERDIRTFPQVIHFQITTGWPQFNYQ